MKFQEGQSGNPNGRPKGVIDRRTLFRRMIDPHKSDLVNKAVEMALEGNEQMLRLILDRVLPAKPKSEPVEDIMLDGVTPSNDGRAVLIKMGAGEIAPDEANSLLQAIVSQAKLIEHTELVERIELLEKKCNEKQD